MTSPTRSARSPRTAWAITLVTGLVLALGLTALTVVDADAVEQDPRAQAAETAQTRAKSALALAIAELNKHHPGKANAALRTYAKESARAHRQAIGLIGEPPTDPESDDVPGPPAILKMIRLDHKATMSLVPHLDGQTATGTVAALRKALQVTHTQRNRMIAQVTGLPPEGTGSDYADSMSDVLGIFPKELTLIDTGLGSYTLTDVGRTSLSATRERVAAADEMMNGAYGGGE